MSLEKSSPEKSYHVDWSQVIWGRQGIAMLSDVQLGPQYAVQVWDPFLSKNIQKLELVQKFALKMCCKSWNSTYSENLQQSSLPTLSFRRKYLCLSYFYNLVNGHFAFPDVPATLYQNPYNTRSSYSSIYVPGAYSGFEIGGAEVCAREARAQKLNHAH